MTETRTFWLQAKKVCGYSSGPVRERTGLTDKDGGADSGNETRTKSLKGRRRLRSPT